MRTLSVIKEALLVLVSSVAAALLLFVCLQEIIRPAGVQDATLGRLIPITTNKSPWWLLIAAVLLAVWFCAHAMGKPRGVLWGLWRWGVRIGFWWSAVALLLFAGRRHPWRPYPIDRGSELALRAGLPGGVDLDPLCLRHWPRSHPITAHRLAGRACTDPVTPTSRAAVPATAAMPDRPDLRIRRLPARSKPRLHPSGRSPPTSGSVTRRRSGRSATPSIGRA